MQNSTSSTSSGKNRSFVNYYSTAIAFVISGALAFVVEKQLQHEATGNAVIQQTRALVSDLERTLDIPRSLSGYVSMHPEIDQDELANYVRVALNSRDLKIKPMSIQLAPGGVVSYEVPWAGGPHIGDDLFADPDWRSEAQQAVQTQTTVIAGPLTLKQGGEALIAHHPVTLMHSTEDLGIGLWGLATILVDWNMVVDRLNAIERELDVSLVVARVNGGETTVAYSTSPDLSSSIEPVFSSQFASGLLQLSFKPRFHFSLPFFLFWLSAFSLIVVAYYAIQKRLKDTHALEQQRLQKAHRASLNETLRYTQTYLKAGVNAYIVQDANFKLVHASEAALEFLQFKSLEELPPDHELYVDLSRADIHELHKKLRNLPAGERYVSETPVRIWTASGDIRQVNMAQRWFPAADGQSYLLITSFEDMTALVEQINFNEQLLNKSPAIILTESKDFRILSCSDAWTSQLGFTREETLGRELLEFFVPEQHEKVMIARSKMQTEKVESADFEASLLNKKGDIVHVQLNASVDTSSSSWRMILTITDVTSLVRAREELTKMVEHDELTGLLSRRGMKARFSDDQRENEFALYVIDLDHFKSVNDSFGHEAGDHFLSAVGNTMRRLTSECGGQAIRLGGEEFALIRPWMGWDDAQNFGDALRQAISETSVEANSREVKRTASIGISYLTPDGQLSAAMHLADLVLREVKIQGRNKVLRADEEMIEHLKRSGAFIQAHDLQSALEAGELFCVVQPIWNVRDEKIEGFEALIRWMRPSGESIQPGQFVDMLYEVIRDPMYASINNIIWKDALERLKEFPDAYVSFNFKLEQLAYEGAAKDIHKVLSSISDHPGRQLVIELSEAALDSRVNTMLLRDELQKLCGFGYQIALDDFGIESSNIKRLQDFPIDIVKVDKSLIDELEFSERSRATLSSIADMLDRLKIKSIVEGVETVEQAIILRDINFNTQQGFIHARPMRPELVKKCLPDVGMYLPAVMVKTIVTGPAMPVPEVETPTNAKVKNVATVARAGTGAHSKAE